MSTAGIVCYFKTRVWGFPEPCILMEANMCWPFCCCLSISLHSQYLADTFIQSSLQMRTTVAVKLTVEQQYLSAMTPLSLI